MRYLPFMLLLMMSCESSESTPHDILDTLFMKDVVVGNQCNIGERGCSAGGIPARCREGVWEFGACGTDLRVNECIWVPHCEDGGCAWWPLGDPDCGVRYEPSVTWPE